MRREIRCCCQPTKLLGWIDVPKETKCLRFAISTGLTKPTDEATLKIEHIILPLADIFNNGQCYKAFKSEETPIETLRMIPGFVEALATGAHRHE